MARMITARAEKSARYPTFSFGARPDPREYRGIWKKCCRASETSALWRLRQNSDGRDGVILGKQELGS
jgi:hypothetical protein